MEVNIKQELSKLDRNDFMAVVDLVDKIVYDLSDLLIDVGDEIMLAAAKDYMIDLINPALLDFDNEQSEQMEIAREVMKQDIECLRNLSKNNDDLTKNSES
jgi:hypothetical protein